MLLLYSNDRVSSLVLSKIHIYQRFSPHQTRSTSVDTLKLPSSTQPVPGTNNIKSRSVCTGSVLPRPTPGRDVSMLATIQVLDDTNLPSAMVLAKMQRLGRVGAR